jgi:hypothetical protein
MKQLEAVEKEMGFDVEVDLLISTETWTSVYLLTQL